MKKLAIIGAGASGLCAAIEANKANPHIEITIFERMQKSGKKLLATGNGRCNFTNNDLSLNHFYGNADFIKTVLSGNFSDIKNFFNNLGILSYEEDGRIYPRSQQASTIKDTLVKSLETENVIIRTNCCISNIQKSQDGFVVDGEYFDSVILCGGGKASSVHGSDGSCYKFAEAFGHTLTTLYPALCGLIISDKDLNLLKGVRAECNAKLYSGNTLLDKDAGEIQFTDKAISGIPIMNLSHLCENRRYLKITLDLCPEITEKDLFNHVKQGINNSPNNEFEMFLNGIVNLKLGFAIMNRSGIKPQTKCNALKDFQIQEAVYQLKNFEINIKSAKGFDNAQVTKGGIRTDEISAQTMMSKKADGLFLCGEILNIHGDCGGYNLHLAFTTGRIAGHSAGKFLK